MLPKRQTTLLREAVAVSMLERALLPRSLAVRACVLCTLLLPQLAKQGTASPFALSPTPPPPPLCTSLVQQQLQPSRGPLFSSPLHSPPPPPPPPPPPKPNPDKSPGFSCAHPTQTPISCYPCTASSYWAPAIINITPLAVIPEPVSTCSARSRAPTALAKKFACALKMT